MHLTLYREFYECALGHKPGWTHSAIRTDGRTHIHTANFEYIAEKYSWTVDYTTDISAADLVLFNLDRNHIYANLNPILLLDNKNLESIQGSSVPVVFWHAGECHSATMKPWFSFATNMLGRNIWYIDSNVRTTTDNHMFYDSAEFIIERHQGRISNCVVAPEHAYKFFMLTSRGDVHKHIICNHLANHHGENSYRHYLRPGDLNTNQDHWTKGKFDITKPPGSSLLSEQEVGQVLSQSSVIISLNSYFANEFNAPPGFRPLYITEKFLVDAWTGKPVLPVGHCGLVNYYRNLGFALPDWIDYSYDSVPDDCDRMAAILAEINRLSQLDLTSLSNQFSQSNHNRNLVQSYTTRSTFETIVSRMLTQSL